MMRASLEVVYNPLVAEKRFNLVLRRLGLRLRFGESWSYTGRNRRGAGELLQTDGRRICLRRITTVSKNEVHTSETCGERSLLSILGFQKKSDDIDSDWLAGRIGLNLLPGSEDYNIL
jgi:hypothetical protein